MYYLVEKQNNSLFDRTDELNIIYKSKYKFLCFLKKFIIEFTIEPGPKSIFSYYVTCSN
jgi:hypothetical protein